MTHHDTHTMAYTPETRLLKHFIDTWPIRVMYQYQGMNVSTWVHIRRTLGPYMGLRIVKASQVSYVLPQGTQPQVHLQGSCCVFGASRLEDIATLYRVGAMYPNTMVLLGGHWHGHYWNHLDVSHVAHLPHPSLLHQNVCNTLQRGLQGVPTLLEAFPGHPIGTIQAPMHGLLTLLHRVGNTPL